MSTLIGFTAKAGSGKDTCALILKEKLEDVEIFSFAQPLKEACRLLFGFSDEQLYDPKIKEQVDSTWGKSPRQIFQWLGTDILRDHIDKNFFVKLMTKRIQNSTKKFVIIPDVRFDNEAALVKELGGIVIKIERPNAETTIHSEHATEQGINQFDELIINDGSLEVLVEKLSKSVSSFILVNSF